MKDVKKLSEIILTVKMPESGRKGDLRKLKIGPNGDLKNEERAILEQKALDDDRIAQILKILEARGQ